MEKLMVCFFLNSLLLGCCSSDVTSQSITGSWKNELGSVLVIDSVALDNTIYGEYRSSSGVDGKVFPLQGWINKKEDSSMAISFTVKWVGYGSITSWTGYFGKDAEADYIKTLWHLVRPSEENEWERIITNSSTFRLQER